MSSAAARTSLVDRDLWSICIEICVVVFGLLPYLAIVEFKDGFAVPTLDLAGYRALYGW